MLVLLSSTAAMVTRLKQGGEERCVGVEWCAVLCRYDWPRKRWRDSNFIFCFIFRMKNRNIGRSAVEQAQAVCTAHEALFELPSVVQTTPCRCSSLFRLPDYAPVISLACTSLCRVVAPP